MKQLLDVKALARSKDLPFIAKTLAQGFLHGHHNSIQRGVGIEFSQYRAYEPGDELAKVDWKLFARTDKYFVREAERESDINIWFVIDASGSMQHSNSQQDDGGGYSKCFFAKVLTATLAYLAQLQGDSIGCFGLSSKNHSYLPALAGYKHWQKLLLNLNALQAGAMFPTRDQIQVQLHQVRRNGIVFVISDFYQQASEVFDVIIQLLSAKTEVVAVQLQTEDEIYFPFEGAIRFQDLESNQQYLLSAKAAKNQYLANKAQFDLQLQNFLQQHGVSHWQINIDQPIDEVIHRYMLARMRVAS